MRGILVAGLLSATVVFSGPVAADEAAVARGRRPVAGERPGGDRRWLGGRGAGRHDRGQHGAGVDLHSTMNLAGRIVTGDVALGSVSAAGGFGSLQAATGIGNIQQNSIAVVLSF